MVKSAIRCNTYGCQSIHAKNPFIRYIGETDLIIAKVELLSGFHKKDTIQVPTSCVANVAMAEPVMPSTGIRVILRAIFKMTIIQLL